MATILNDIELRKLFGTIILRGEERCLRPNSYILRVGNSGKFLNTNKPFEIDKEEHKKGVIIPPGHSVGLTSYEDIDFRRETVHEIFPNCDLHAFITPTTNLSREGIVAPATQIDAGWNGTLNWTVVNTSNQERRYLHKTRVFRMTILKLDDGEVPENPYDGHYQREFGYVKSMRHDAPVDMDPDEWERAYVEGGPEDLLEILAKSGPPWNVLSSRLGLIDNKFELVTNEYQKIYGSLNSLTKKVDAFSQEINKVCTEQGSIVEQIGTTIEKLIDKKIPFYEDRWANKMGKVVLGAIAITLAATSQPAIMASIKKYGIYYGLFLLACVVFYHIITRKK